MNKSDWNTHKRGKRTDFHKDYAVPINLDTMRPFGVCTKCEDAPAGKNYMCEECETQHVEWLKSAMGEVEEDESDAVSYKYQDAVKGALSMIWLLTKISKEDISEAMDEIDEVYTQAAETENLRAELLYKNNMIDDLRATIERIGKKSAEMQDLIENNEMQEYEAKAKAFDQYHDIIGNHIKADYSHDRNDMVRKFANIHDDYEKGEYR